MSSTKGQCSDARLAKSKKRSLHGVNEHFFDERNAAGGHYGQALIIPAGFCGQVDRGICIHVY